MRNADFERGEEQEVTIVGVDEADLEAGKISWVSPLARALLKARRGDTVDLREASGFWPGAPGPGTIDHVAFRGEDFPAYRARLDAHWGAAWHQPDLHTECWMIGMGLADELSIPFTVGGGVSSPDDVRTTLPIARPYSS